MSKPILFVSSNYTWGGSEILWSQAALKMLKDGFYVNFAVRYKEPIINDLVNKGAIYFDLNAREVRLSLFQRVLIKLRLKKVTRQEVFSEVLIKSRPELVIISQGNNIDGGYYMGVCRQLSIPYITVTQLVTEVLWLSLDDKKINELISNYSISKKNFFVSNDNLMLHNIMLGSMQENAAVINNPFTVPVAIKESYQRPSDGNFHLAIVARLDTYHKGHDLLLKVLSQQKWKNRAIKFHFYGSGPHKELLERLVKHYEIKNVVFEGHVNDVASIWDVNQMLILPSRMEGQALALIEAMWCYRAAIVTNVGGAKELIKDSETGFIAENASVHEIDAALERAWNHRDRWQDLGRKAGLEIRNIFSELPVQKFTDEVTSLLN